jgi:hypothetical protein
MAPFANTIARIVDAFVSIRVRVLRRAEWRDAVVTRGEILSEVQDASEAA